MCFSVSMDRKTKVEAASGGFVSDTLHRKLKDLEEENLSLRSEVIPTSAQTRWSEAKLLAVYSSFNPVCVPPGQPSEVRDRNI